jgi:hypothetical protein
MTNGRAKLRFRATVLSYEMDFKKLAIQ